MVNELLTRFNLMKCKDTRVGDPRNNVIGLSVNLVACLLIPGLVVNVSD